MIYLKQILLKQQLFILLFSLLLYPAVAITAPEVIDKQLDSEEVEELSYTQSKCIECHLFSEKELMSQIRIAQNRHRKAKSKNKSCSDCHDQEEVVGICCHSHFPR